LRRYSNYLAPKVGLLSTDSLTLMAVWVRNVFSTSSSSVSFLMSIFLLPKALIPTTMLLQHYGPALKHAAAFLGLLLMPVAIAWSLLHRGEELERRRPWLVSTGGVLVTVLLPGALAAIAGSIWLFGTDVRKSFDIQGFVVATVGLLLACALAWAVQVLRRQESAWTKDLGQGPIFFVASILAAVPAAGVLKLTCYLMTGIDDGILHTAIVMTVGPPAFLFAFGLAGSIYVGFVGALILNAAVSGGAG